VSAQHEAHRAVVSRSANTTPELPPS
jgi:hypothetical protein